MFAVFLVICAMICVAKKDETVEAEILNRSFVLIGQPIEER